MKSPWLAVWFWLLTASYSPSQTIRFSDIAPTYTGVPAPPRVFVDGIRREAALSYREILSAEAPAVFSNIPQVLPLSYPSLGFSASSTNALGNLVELAGGQRVADHVEVVMVTWATAAKYPALGALDPSGYRHPVTASIYELQTDSDGVTTLRLLDKATAQVQIPWRPATLPDGAPYPFNGYAFKALIPLSAEVPLPNTCIISIGFDTQNSGASPVGVAGPYNELNLALSSSVPSIGRDPNADAVFWSQRDKWYYPASNWGGFGSPILRLFARDLPLPEPLFDPALEPVNAGVYHVRAVIEPENLDSDTVLTISKASVVFQTAGLTKSIADPDPFISVLNRSPGLAVDITYDGSAAVPARPGRYPFVIAATDRNHSGFLTGEFRLTGQRFEQWRDQEFPAGQPGGQAAWLAYATGGDPRMNAQPLQLTASQGGMSARFRQRREMSGVRVALEFSPDLSHWSTVSTEQEAADEFWEILSATSAAPAGFFRLKAATE